MTTNGLVLIVMVSVVLGGTLLLFIFGHPGRYEETPAERYDDDAVFMRYINDRGLAGDFAAYVSGGAVYDGPDGVIEDAEDDYTSEHFRLGTYEGGFMRE